LRPRRSSFDVDAKRSRASELETQAADPSLWEDQARAQRVTTDLARLREELTRVESLERRLGDAVAIDDLLSDGSDADLEKELRGTLTGLETELEKVETAALLGGEYDANDAVVTLHAGAGGTESQDWAEMLLRMYLRWAEREGLDVELDELLPGEEAGIKSTTFIVHGHNAYGLLSAERGVHRLVRISPFDAAKRRHTSFASLDLIPLLEEDEEIEIDPKELRIDTYRSSSAGGQHVNVTDSAVRITHLPTGITAACQNERSQMQNRAVAMRILKARLAERARLQHQEKLENLRGEQRDIDFGSQIRSYVLHPYRMVKDHRTDVETGDVDRVLDGDIDRFIEAYLRWRAGEAAA
jgi:peptide chain release factor 2